jgi:hypothetical protein
MSPNTPFFRIACLCVVAISLLALSCRKEQVANQQEIDEKVRKFNEEMNRRAERERVVPTKENRDLIQKNSDEYSRLPAKTQLAKEPYLKNKLVILEQRTSTETLEGKKLEASDRRERFWIMYDLDRGIGDTSYPKVKTKKLSALTPDDVGTVVLLKFRADKIGTYSSMGEGKEKRDPVPAFQWSCDLTLVDRSIPAVIYKKSFKGKEPDMVTMVSRNTTYVDGNKPFKEIDEFLSNLPQK